MPLWLLKNAWSDWKRARSAALTETDAGNLPSITLTVSNVSREIIATLESYNGLIGQPVRIILTNMGALSDNNAAMQHDFKILNTTATAETVGVQLGDISLYESSFPGQRMMRHFCRHQYRAAACGYVVAASDPDYLATCDKSLDGLNGCEAHGVSETAAGVPAIHPNRFGGFPGIPTPTTEGSI